MKKYLLIFVLDIISILTIPAQTYVNFDTISSKGTILIFAHQDDDFIWMLPWWPKVQKFICGTMPQTPVYERTIDDQQADLNLHLPSVDYKSRWEHPWSSISHWEYERYYWNKDISYNYLGKDHVLTQWNDDSLAIYRTQVNRIKAKIESYIADTATQRIITHNNWGEYGHQQHRALNQAVRELAVKYGKDVWMLANSMGSLQWSIVIPPGITYTRAVYDSVLYSTLRQNYIDRNVWTYTSYTPSGYRPYIKIVDKGVDQSAILLPGTEVTVAGSLQDKPGAYIFNGTSDYISLPGNNYRLFTIGMWVCPAEIKAMDIAHMIEYPDSTGTNRCLFMDNDGRVTVRASNTLTDTVSSTTLLQSNVWSHLLLTCDGDSLRFYINGSLEKTAPASQFSSYVTPEFVIGHARETSSYFKGQVADVRFYDYALPDSQIVALAGNNPPAFYSLSAICNQGGTITPYERVFDNAGSSRTYSIVSKPFYVLSDVKVDSVSIGAVSQYTFSNISSNHTIIATFTQQPSIALNKPATSQSYEVYQNYIYSPDKANDSNVSDNDNQYWSAYPYPQWWKVDLQNIYDVSGVIVRPFCDPGRYYQYEIWASTDNINFTKVSEKKNTIHVTDDGDTHIFNARARYLKLIMTYNSHDAGVQVTDFRVFGTPAYLRWKGTVNNSWNTPANWSPAVVPVETSSVIIPDTGVINYPTLTVPGACGDLTLESEATLVGSRNLTVQHTVKVKQYLTSGRDWAVTSPVSAATSDVFAADSLHPMYFYDEPNGSTDPWVVINNKKTSIAAMKGYVVNVVDPETIIFTGGVLNSGNMQMPLSYTQGHKKEGFNLVGNPFTAYLNWDLVEKSDLSSNTIWYSTFDGRNYRFYTYNSVNGSGGISVPDLHLNFIPPIQAFWVRSKPGGGILSFADSMCTHKDYPNDRIRVKQKANSLMTILRLQVSNPQDSDETVIYFTSEAQNGYDKLDSPKMFTNNPSIPEIYTLSGKEQLVINGMNSIPYDTNISLGFKTGSRDSFQLRMSQEDNLPENVNVLLCDSEVGTETNITYGAVYHFTSDIASTTTRFSIIFRDKGPVTAVSKEMDSPVLPLFVSSKNENFIIYNGLIPDNAVVSVYSILGQKIFNQQIVNKKTVIHSMLSSGTYLVVVKHGMTEVLKKLVVLE